MRCMIVVLSLLVALPVLAQDAPPEPPPIFHSDVFKSFYRDDVAIRYIFRLPEAELPNCRLTLAISPEGSDQAAVTRQFVGLDSLSGVLRLPTADLPLGRYRLQVVATRNGEELARQEHLFPQLRDPGVTSRLVTVRPSDHMLIVEGKPFFPIGIYESPGTESYMKMLADAGFNLCRVSGGPSPMLPKLLDMIHANGMRVWITASHTLDLSKETERRSEQFTKMVEQVGNHPGLLVWESIDEPAWGKQSAEGLYDGYCVLRKLDQQHPIWTNHAPRNTIEELAYFNRATDIGGVDIYPVPAPATQSDLPNKAISVVGDEADKNIAAVNGDKPIFMVLQGFGWRELSKPDPAKPPIMPTFAQSRFMAYQSIVHGANGVLYWGTHATQKPAEFWSELRSLVSELAALQEVLASEAVAGQVTVAPAGAARLLHKRHNGFNTIILVNEQPEPVKVTLTVPAMKADRLRRLFEGRNYGINNRKVFVELAGYDVAVLSDDLKFADQRKDFSAEWRNAPPPPVVTEPGNALRNAGFEVDQDQDGSPDGWTSRVALSATISDEAHSGSHSLRLQGFGGDISPLVVQSNTELKAGGKYRFSGWVKTEGDVEVRFYTEWVTEGKFYPKCLPFTRGTGEWQQLQFEFEATPDPSGRAYAVAQVKGEGAAYFDDMKLEAVE